MGRLSAVWPGRVPVDGGVFGGPGLRGGRRRVGGPPLVFGDGGSGGDVRGQVGQWVDSAGGQGGVGGVASPGGGGSGAPPVGGDVLVAARAVLGHVARGGQVGGSVGSGAGGGGGAQPFSGGASQGPGGSGVPGTGWGGVPSTISDGKSFFYGDGSVIPAGVDMSYTGAFQGGRPIHIPGYGDGTVAFGHRPDPGAVNFNGGQMPANWNPLWYLDPNAAVPSQGVTWTPVDHSMDWMSGQ